MEIKVENLNPYPIQVIKIAHKVTKVSNDTLLADGTTHLKKQLTVPAMSDATTTATAAVRYTGMGAAAKSLCTRGMTTIRIHCHVTIASHTLGLVEIPVVVHTCDIALS